MKNSFRVLVSRGKRPTRASATTFAGASCDSTFRFAIRWFVGSWRKVEKDHGWSLFPARTTVSRDRRCYFAVFCADSAKVSHGLFPLSVESAVGIAELESKVAMATRRQRCAAVKRPP